MSAKKIKLFIISSAVLLFFATVIACFATSSNETDDFKIVFIKESNILEKI